MKAANTQFNKEFKKMNIDEIEDTVSFHVCRIYAFYYCCSSDWLLFPFALHINYNHQVDDLADMMEDMNEVNDILSRSFDIGEEIDEGDLDAELEGLDDELAALDTLEEEEEQEVTTPSYMAAGLSSQKESNISLPEEPRGQAQAPVDIGGGNGGLPVSRSAVPNES